ncbi:ABC transporter permease [Arenivirga flava]|uniref:ABC transporter permease n=1 Tax=Arenivirga flava TaxID=1930060 RepID=A0AA37UHQ6_9MICO|nr:ABC transporter permease [Arenivirga flava]GMA29455.1 ABC transporter permease [Arenivirga flava]
MTAAPTQRRRTAPGAAALLRALASRLGAVLMVLWGAATLAFLALQLVPGDPVDTIIGVDAQVGEETRARVREDLGLDLPPWLRYLQYLGGLLVGDLGTSFQARQPVAEVIGSAVGPTLQLAAAALGLAVLLALVGAVLSRGVLRGFVSAVELVAASTPTFWSGLLLITVFSFGLGWFPIIATRDAASLVLPAVTLAIPVAAILGQVLREGLDAAAAEPFALTVRARGAGPIRLLGHTLRHAGVGTLALAGYLLGSLLGGAVLVETVFGRAGLGRMVLAAILNRDLPVVMALVVLSGLVFAVLSQVADLGARALDPRLRSSERASG